MAFEIIKDAHWSSPITTDTFRLATSLYESTIKPFRDDNYTYKLFIRIKTIMTGMFKAKTEVEEFLEIENHFISCLWTLQDLFVIKANNKYTCWEVIRTFWEKGERKVECRIIRDGGENKNTRTYLFIDGVHGIYVMWDTERLSSYFLWWPILQALSKMLKSARTSSKMDAKRFVRVVNHTNQLILEKEREAYENEEDPFLTVYKRVITTDKSGKVFESEPISGGATQYHSITADSKTTKIWENIWNHRNFWFSLAGIPTQNNGDRQSGKSDGENIVEIVDNLYQLEVTLRNLKVFGRKIKNMYGDDLDFEHTINIAKAYSPELDTVENEANGEDENGE